MKQPKQVLELIYGYIRLVFLDVGIDVPTEYFDYKFQEGLSANTKSLYVTTPPHQWGEGSSTSSGSNMMQASTSSTSGETAQVLECFFELL